MSGSNPKLRSGGKAALWLKAPACCPSALSLTQGNAGQMGTQGPVSLEVTLVLLAGELAERRLVQQVLDHWELEGLEPVPKERVDESK